MEFGRRVLASILSLPKTLIRKLNLQLNSDSRLQEGHIDLAIPPNDHFQMTVDDRSSWQPVIERIIERLALMLSLQPWERYEEPPEEHQQTIGFLRFSPELPAAG